MSPMTSASKPSSTSASSLTKPVSGEKADRVFRGVAYACGILILVVLAAVALFLLFRAWPLIGGNQQANNAIIANFTGGKATNFWSYVGPLLFGTVLVAALALSAACNHGIKGDGHLSVVQSFADKGHAEVVLLCAVVKGGQISLRMVGSRHPHGCHVLIYCQLGGCGTGVDNQYLHRQARARL